VKTITKDHWADVHAKTLRRKEISKTYPHGEEALSRGSRFIYNARRG